MALLFILYAGSQSLPHPLRDYCFAAIQALGMRQNSEDGQILGIMTVGSGMLVLVSTLLFKSLFPDDR